VKHFKKLQSFDTLHEHLYEHRVLSALKQYVDPHLPF